LLGGAAAFPGCGLFLLFRIASGKQI